MINAARRRWQLYPVPVFSFVLISLILMFILKEPLLEPVIAKIKRNVTTPIGCNNTNDLYTHIYETYINATSSRDARYPFSPAQKIPPTNLTNQNWVRTLGHIASIVKTPDIDCQALFYLPIANDVNTTNNTVRMVGIPMCDTAYKKLTSNCTAFKQYRGYITSPLTAEEKDFPLAYSMIVYKNAEMVERLLRSIYRPQNYYCIHVDKKSTDEFFMAIASIAQCFSNVFLPSERVFVVWGQYSVLEPELICMEELWKFPKWKYYLTLTGQEFPLKTNLQIVKILTAYKGANDVNTTVKLNFIDYVLHNETATDLLQWAKDTEVPDETFFAILAANPQLGIKGTYTGEPEHNDKLPFLSRFKNWGTLPCAGRYVREICILSTGDLPQLVQAKHLFANKFFLDEDRVVIACLEEKIFNDTRDESAGVTTFNTSYYENLVFVKNQVQ